MLFQYLCSLYFTRNHIRHLTELLSLRRIINLVRTKAVMKCATKVHKGSSNPFLGCPEDFITNPKLTHRSVICN